MCYAVLCAMVVYVLSLYVCACMLSAHPVDAMVPLLHLRLRGVGEVHVIQFGHDR